MKDLELSLHLWRADDLQNVQNKTIIMSQMALKIGVTHIFKFGYAYKFITIVKWTDKQTNILVY